MKVSNMKRAVTKNGAIIIGILFIIAIALVRKRPTNLIKEDGNVKEQLSEVLDTVKTLQVVAEDEDENEDETQPVVWIRIRGEPEESTKMRRIRFVFERLGYKQGSQFSKWDVLWSHWDPIQELDSLMKTIGPHQKVNHIPGSSIFQNKKELVTSIDVQNIPKAFSMPLHYAAFKNYAKRHPDYLWVQKNEGHRGIKVVKPEAVRMASRMLIQRYIDNPLLMDGKRFDVGIYVAVTSVDPLRVYIHDDDMLIRVCPEDYYPFDPKNLRKYVIAENYTQPYKIPSMKKLLIDKGFTYKDALLSYLRTNGYNDTKILNDMHDTIREVFIKIQKNLVIDPSSHLSNRNFFDISRFDFIIDNDTNVHLLEANMSPALANSPPEYNHYMMHNAVVYSMLTMIGVGRNTQEHFMTSSNDSQHMMVSERNIRVYSDLCVSSQCENNCQDIYCNLCRGCQDDDFSLDLKHTVMEHNNRGDWKRIFPRVFKDSAEAKLWDPLKDPDFQKSTPKNKRMAVWIKGKCMRDNRWCLL